MRKNSFLSNQRFLSWLKRFVALLTVGIWLVLMLSIFRAGGGFSAQAPKCIFTTMIVFGILTAIHKGIEILEKRGAKEGQEDSKEEK